MDYLKAEQLGTARWRVLAIPFGGPFKGDKDADGEYFSPRTDIKEGWMKERPVLFNHGGDELTEDEELGIEGDLVKDKYGWWGDMWLDRSNRYWAQVNRMLQAGKMHGSSGALGHLVKKAPDGEILVWPHIEQSLTLTPANPLSRVVPIKSLVHFQRAGIELDEATRALFDTDSPTPDYAGLPTGGDDAARGRLAGDISALLERIKTI